MAFDVPGPHSARSIGTVVGILVVIFTCADSASVKIGVAAVILLVLFVGWINGVIRFWR